MIVEALVLLVALILAIWKYVKNKNDLFVGRNCKHDIFFPILGSMRSLFFKRKSILDVAIEIYEKAEGNKIYGVFENNKPAFYINDPELIRRITIKDFEHFVNHRNVLADVGDTSFFSSSLFLMQNQKWKDMRSTLSPVFTGSRMRMMFQLVADVVIQARDHLKMQKNIASGQDVDMKEFFSHYTNDIIASIAFGIHINSLKDVNNEFYVVAKNIFKFSILRSLKFVAILTCSFFAKWFKIQLFSKKETDYFKTLVLDAMKYRTEHKIVRHDMINMLMEARGMGVVENSKENLKSPHEWSDVEIVAQCFLFFAAGFESTATLLSFVAHELMENPGIQEKLLNEINEVEENLDGKPLTYEALNGMKYLDMVVSETLRKWPATPGADRVCSKDITFENPDGLGDFTIHVGEGVFIPFAALHRDPKYFPDPEKFDPERFSDENKHNIQPFTYLPFGIGPRSCIGNRLALMEAKAILFYLVGEYSLEPSLKSTIPLKLSGSSFQLKPKNGFWLKLRARIK